MATCPHCRVIYADGAETRCPQDGNTLLPDTAFANVDPDLAEGEVVGEYRVEGKLGEGGFGAVFKAVQPLIGKQVAIKVLNRQYSSNPQMVSRFVAEARAVNQIRHRNIIDIFSFSQLPDGRHYYVMELLAGSTLDEYVGERGRLTLAEAMPILRALARALDAAHAKGIAHRDLKPENVFIGIDDDGAPYPKLLDFGIAKLLASDTQLQHKTRTGAPIGTPYYMSPEQCRGRDVDHRTDIYSFGVMMYQMLTGKLPFTGQDFMEILLKQISEWPIPPSAIAGFPESVDQRVLWFLQKDPAQRPPNLVTGVRALEEAVAAAGISIPTPGTGVYGAQSTPTPNSLDQVPTPSRITPAVSPSRTNPAASISGNSLGTAQTMEAQPGMTPGYLAAEASAAPASRNKMGLILGVAVGALAAAVVIFFLVKNDGAAGTQTAAAPAPAKQGAAPSPEPVKVEPPPPSPSSSPSPGEIQASASPSPSPEAATVSLEIAGAPDGTDVLAGGIVVGTAPGVVSVSRGSTPIKLEFRAKGYKPEFVEVTPVTDGKLEVALEKKSAGKSSKSGGKKPGKDDIEDAFKD